MRATPQLSPLGFGGAPIGGLYDAVNEQEAIATVRRALALGMTYLDTAPHYGLGDSERRLGRALAGLPREAFVLSTKVGRLLVPRGVTETVGDEGFATSQPLKRTWDFSRDGIRRSLEQSLDRLGLDQIDVLYLHDPDDHEREVHETAFPALAQLRDEGLVTAIGAGMNQAEMLTRLVRTLDLDVVLIAGRYSLLDQTAAETLFPACLERGVRAVVGGALNSGLLANPYAGAHYDYGVAPAALVQRAQAIDEVCGRYGVQLISAALQFPLAHPAVASVLVGARSVGEVESNAQAFAAPVPGELWATLHDAGLLSAAVPVPTR